MAGTIDVETLKDIPLFQSLTPDQRANLATFFFEKNYTKNSTLFIEGMQGEILYVIKKGAVQLVKKTANSQEAVLAVLREGELLGEMSLIDNRPRSASAKVAEESILLVMTKKAFNTMIEKYPEIALKVVMFFLRIANERLRKANESFKQV